MKPIIALSMTAIASLVLSGCGSKLSDEQAFATFKISGAEKPHVDQCISDANAAGISIAKDKSNAENCACFVRELTKRNVDHAKIGATVDMLGALMADKARRGKGGGGPGDTLSKAIVAVEQKHGLQSSEGTELMKIGMQSTLACK